MCRTFIYSVVDNIYCDLLDIFFYVLEHVHRRLFGAFRPPRLKKGRRCGCRLGCAGWAASLFYTLLSPAWIELCIVILNCNELYRDPNLISTLPYL